MNGAYASLNLADSNDDRWDFLKAVMNETTSPMAHSHQRTRGLVHYLCMHRNWYSELTHDGASIAGSGAWLDSPRSQIR